MLSLASLIDIFWEKRNISQKQNQNSPKTEQRNFDVIEVIASRQFYFIFLHIFLMVLVHES